MIKFIDLFAGIGGFHLGLDKANAEDCSNDKSGTSQHGRRAFRCVWANENNKYAVQVYQKRFPKTPLSQEDIRSVDTNRIPDFDLLCGGFPCQAFSLAGKRKGFNDTRGTLFFEIARILKTKRPRIVLLENVKGLLSHDSGRTFAKIIQTLDELGYWVEWQILNSKDFGVPQNRERVFIIGHLGRKGGQKIFPIQNINQETDKQQVSKQIAQTISASQYKLPRGINMIQVGFIGNNAEANRVYSTKGISKTIKYGGGMGAKTGLYAIDYRNNGITDIVPTLLGNDHNTIHRVIDGIKVRRLTPKECERLQGFPDNFTHVRMSNNKFMSNTQRYKCIGNAVTVNVIEAIGKEILS